MSKQFGKLESVDIRKLWPKEEHDFTPWLKDYGLQMLVDAIGIDAIEDARIEVKCSVDSNFEADLVARYAGSSEDDEGQVIVVENQYGPTDGGHLGRLMMYAATQRASTVVWITEKYRKEYMDTIDWLNENSSDNVSYYLVQIAAYRIGDSLPAPKFEVIAKPSEQSVEMEKKKELSESKQLCLSFWKSCSEDKAFTDKLKDAGLALRKPNTDPWKDFTLRVKGIWISIAIATRTGRIKTNLCVKNDNPLYDQFFSEQFLAKLGAAVGQKVQPGDADRKVFRTINFYSDINVAIKDQWPSARKWFLDVLLKIIAFLKDEKIVKL